MDFYFSFLVKDSLQLGFQLLACLPQMVNFLCMSLNSIGVIIISVIIAIIVIIVIIVIIIVVAIMIEIFHLFLGLPSLSRFLLDHLARHPQIRHLMIMMMMMMVMMVMIPTIS